MKNLFFSVSFLVVFIASAQPIGFQYGKIITINSAIVTGTNNLNDFPFLFKITDPDLRITGNGGFVSNANGYDIIFTDASCSTNLKHEVEKYNPTTGELTCWIKIPQLSYSVNTTIHVYYGNPSVTIPTSTNSTWSSDYDCVLHLGNNPTAIAPQIIDSAPSANSGTCLGAMTATNSVNGKIGSAILFDEIDDGIEISDFDYTQSFTISFWFYLTEVNGTAFQYLYSHGSFGTTNSTNIYFGEDNLSFTTDQKMLKNIFQDSNDATNTSGLDATNAYVNSFWHYYTFVVGNSGGATVYVDGVQKAYLSYLGGNSYNPSSNIFLGCRSDLNSARFLGGIMDEFRILNAPRSADWISTEYTNQNSPTTYYSIGAQTTASVQCVILPIELADFQVIPNDEAVVLEWETWSEKNNEFFCLERCSNGLDFKEIARLSGAINSQKLTKYTYTDQFPLQGIGYYRLKQVDLDGNFSYSKIIYADFNPIENKISIYPNPSKGKFTLDLKGDHFYENDLIHIYNGFGSIVFTHNFSNEELGSKVEIDLTELPKGFYYLVLDKKYSDSIKLKLLCE